LFFGICSSDPKEFRASIYILKAPKIYICDKAVSDVCFLLQKLGDIMEMMFGGRYVIIMMALFSIYTGLIYNEFFSVPFELFGKSAYACRDPSCG
jgi:hypothetical protein